jgi:DNA-binding LacI/PurR family transcriptional regulator
MEKVLRDRQKQGYPIVVVFPVNIATWSANAIDVDNDAVGYTVGRLFRERGRKRWLLAQYERPNHPQRLRREGFLRFAEEAGIQVQTAVLPGEVTEATGADLVASRLARAKADAVYGLDYVLSVGSLLGCVRLGLKPGEDVDLVGCDCSAWHSVHLPQITCVDVSWLEVGALAVEQLTKMQQAGTSHFDTILLPPRIATGGTCPVTKKAAGSSA